MFSPEVPPDVFPDAPPDVWPDVPDEPDVFSPEVPPDVFPDVPDVLAGRLLPDVPDEPDVLPDVLPDDPDVPLVLDGPEPWTSAQIAHTSSVHLPKGSPDAFAAQPEPSASGADVRNNAVATLVPAPPPITCLPLGQFAVTDFVAPLDDELTTRTVSTERT